MGKTKYLALGAAALVASLAFGSIGIAAAAPATDPATGEAMGYGLRIGYTLRESGGRMVDILADLTGLSEDAVHDRRVAGESVADIAESEGVDPDTVVDKALDARKDILDQRVADGTIDSETRDEVLARMTERLNDRVDSTEVGGFGRGRGAGGGAGCGGACVAPAQTSTTQ